MLRAECRIFVKKWRRVMSAEVSVAARNSLPEVHEAIPRIRRIRSLAAAPISR